MNVLNRPLRHAQNCLYVQILKEDLDVAVEMVTWEMEQIVEVRISCIISKTKINVYL